MSNTINIFNTLPQHQSDSEDEGHEQVQPQKNQTNRRQQDEKPKRGGQQETRQQDNKQRQNQPRDQAGQAVQAPKQGRTGVQGDIAKKEDRDVHNHKKDFHKQQKDDLDHPHPNDRHSGQGGQAYGVKPKKGGAGKGNWGKEEGAEVAEGGEVVAGEEGAAPVQPKEEEKIELTLQEYYQKQQKSQGQQQVNEAKAKITSEQLMKEMGTATLLKSRTQQAVDDRKAGKKKEFLDVDHHAGITTEHANLLNFRTGFVEKEYKARREDDGDFNRRGPRPEGDNRRRNNRDQEGQEAVAGEEQTGETQGTEPVKHETEEVRGETGDNRRRGGYGQRRGGYEQRRQYQGEGRFEGDEQGEQGVSTGYRYRGGQRGDRRGGYGGERRGGYGGERRGGYDGERRGGYGGSRRGGYRERGQGQEGEHRGEQREQREHRENRGEQREQRENKGEQQQGGEQQAGEQQQQQRPPRDEQHHERGQGGNRRGGQGGHGGARQGDRPYEARKPYGGKTHQPKVNTTNEADFPKLG